MWAYKDVWADEELLGGGGSSQQVTTADWIALRRLALAQSLTEAQIERLELLGLARRTLGDVACSELGNSLLATRP